MEKLATTQSAADLWAETLALVRSDISPPAYETLASSTSALTLSGGVLLVQVSNNFTRDWIEEKFSPNLASALVKLTEAPLTLRWIVNKSPGAPAGSASPSAKLPASLGTMPASGLNPKYTFTNFVVGPSNRFAHAASLAVAEKPARVYNPLFIYGGVGLGKTHLMQAIGQKVLAGTPRTKAIYASAEKFTNEFIASIQSGNAAAFQNRYRQLDLLLLDDIQFFVGKEKTQEEFFHTFNALFDRSKQIVITSDRPPRETTAFHDRLRSRFEAGLVADIKPPEIETRQAILRQKALGKNLAAPPEVLEFIAEQVPSNIRELEGALVRVAAFASLTGSPLSLSLAEEVLKDTLPRHREKVVTLHQIKKVVAAHFDLSPDILSASSRTQDVALARHIAMYLARQLTDLSLPRIGENFGGRDHTTVLHACQRIASLINSDERSQNLVKSFLTQLRQSVH